MGGSVLADQGRVRVVEGPVDGGNCAAQSLECGHQPRRDVRVDAIHRLARVFERLAKGREHFREVGADRFERELVELRDDAGDFRFEVGNGARNHRQLRHLRAPVSLHLGRIRVKVKGHKELPGEQVAAPELRAQTPLLDQALHEHVALLGASN